MHESLEHNDGFVCKTAALREVANNQKQKGNGNVVVFFEKIVELFVCQIRFYLHERNWWCAQYMRNRSAHSLIRHNNGIHCLCAF